MRLDLPADCDQLAACFLLALAVYREARGESPLGQRAVAWVIRNRVERAGWFGSDYLGVILKSKQFSSFNMGETQSTTYGHPGEGAWRESVHAAMDVMEDRFADPTLGATHYYDRSLDAHPPAWAKTMTPTIDIGAFHFFRQEQAI